jgi:hypothetical protein
VARQHQEHEVVGYLGIREAAAVLVDGRGEAAENAGHGATCGKVRTCLDTGSLAGVG